MDDLGARSTLAVAEFAQISNTVVTESREAVHTEVADLLDRRITDE